MRRKTQSEFVSEVAQSLPDIRVEGTYVNSRTKVAVSCVVCGYKWQANPFDLIYGHGCPRCAGKERKTPERFESEIAAANPGIELIDSYRNTSTKMLVRCRTCRFEWLASPSTLRVGIGCPSCAGTLKKTHDVFVHQLAQVNPGITVLGEYRNNRTKILVRCDRCHHEWSQTPHNLLDARSRCPRCVHSSTSFTEQYIIGFLKQLDGIGEILERDRDVIGMELDVYLPSLRLAFEPGSWVWHRSKLETDARKRSLCAAKDVRLVTIYDEVPLDETPQAENVYCVPYDFKINRDRRELQDLLISVTSTAAGVDFCGSVDWQAVEDYAYAHSVCGNTDEFAAKLAKRNPKIAVIGEYRGSDQRIQVRCKVCGFEWSSRADTLLARNSACRKCGQRSSAKKHLKTPEEFAREVAEENPTVELTGRYRKASERIGARCRLCGYEWSPVASSLVGKHRSVCPSCRGGKRKPKY